MLILSWGWRPLRPGGSEIGTEKLPVPVERSEVSAPSLGDAAQDRFAARAVLAGNETEPCAEIPPAIEGFACSDRCDRGGRDQRSDARNAHQAPAIGFALADLLDLFRDGLDAFVQPKPVFVKPDDQLAHSSRNLVGAIFQYFEERIAERPRPGPQR